MQLLRNFVPTSCFMDRFPTKRERLVRRDYARFAWLALMLIGCIAGCGTTKTQQVTDQMLMSSAVDRTIGEIDFRVIADRKVYLDTRHIKGIKGIGFVNADYIISSLRQQMFASRVRLVESANEAEVVVEARVGALGTDGHDVTYGLPASSTFSTAASLMPNAPAIPTVPELALARRTIDTGGAKIALFAYEKESKEPIWQSGVKTAMSDARNIWVLGAGPFQQGTIYSGTQFAGSRLSVPFVSPSGGRPNTSLREQVAYDQEYHFDDAELEAANPVQLSGYEQETPAPDKPAPEKPAPDKPSTPGAPVVTPENANAQAAAAAKPAKEPVPAKQASVSKPTGEPNPAPIDPQATALKPNAPQPDSPTEPTPPTKAGE